MTRPACIVHNHRKPKSTTQGCRELILFAPFFFFSFPAQYHSLEKEGSGHVAALHASTDETIMSGTIGAAAAVAVASAQQPTSPARRHQIKRSLSEFTSPGKSSKARKDRTGNAGNIEAGNEASSSNGNGNGNGNSNRHLRRQSAVNDTRMSLDIPRNNGFSPVMSPNQSRRGSVLLPPPAKDKDDSQRASSMESKDGRLRQNQARIAGNTEYVQHPRHQSNKKTLGDSSTAYV